MPKLVNSEEIKREIKSEFVTFVNFSNKSNLEYQQLLNTLNGHQFYPPIIEGLKKAGFNPIVQYKRLPDPKFKTKARTSK